MIYTCIDCGRTKVRWIRHTQFSGTHPYCKKCAKKQDDFKQEDPSYFFWEKIDGPNKSS